MYNMTPFEQSNNVAESAIAINTASGNLLFTSFLITLWIILFILLIRRNPAPESFTASSGACTIISLIFLAFGGIWIGWVVGFSLLFAMSGVGLYLRNKTS